MAPLQTYNQYFGQARPVVVDPTNNVNAFATGARLGQQQQELGLEQQRANEFVARGEAERSAQERSWKKEEQEQVKQIARQAFAMADPKEPDDATYVGQVEASTGVMGKGVYALFGEEAAPALQQLVTGVKSLRNPDGSLNPEAIKHSRVIMDAYQKGLGIPERGRKKWVPETKEESLELAAAGKGRARQAGSTRSVQRGSENVTEEWDGAQWTEVGRGPKFKAEAAGNVSEADRLDETLLDRMRRDVAKKWGWSDTLGLDEAKSDKANKTQVRARRYMEEDGLNMDKAIDKAYTEVRIFYAAKDIKERAKGKKAEIESAASTAKELVAMGLPAAELRGVLKAKGWEDKEIGVILENAGVRGAAASQEELVPGEAAGMTDAEIDKIMGW